MSKLLYGICGYKGDPVYKDTISTKTEKKQVILSMKTSYDVLIIASGIAGLNASIFPKSLMCSSSLKIMHRECNTFYAQGGVAVAKMPMISLYVNDTLSAGAGALQ